MIMVIGIVLIPEDHHYNKIDEGGNSGSSGSYVIIIAGNTSSIDIIIESDESFRSG